MRNFSNIHILFLFVTFCWSYNDVSFVQFDLDCEFSLNLGATSMLGKCKGQAKACNKKVNV